MSTGSTNSSASCPAPDPPKPHCRCHRTTNPPPWQRLHSACHCRPLTAFPEISGEWRESKVRVRIIPSTSPDISGKVHPPAGGQVPQPDLTRDDTPKQRFLQAAMATWTLRARCTPSGVARTGVTSQHSGRAPSRPSTRQASCPQEGRKSHPKHASRAGPVPRSPRRPSGHRAKLHEWHRAWCTELLHASPRATRPRASGASRRTLPPLTSRTVS